MQNKPTKKCTGHVMGTNESRHPKRKMMIRKEKSFLLSETRVLNYIEKGISLLSKFDFSRVCAQKTLINSTT